MATAPNTFPARLQWLREKRGISRRVLSELCGMGKNQIARLERGEREPRLNDLMELSDFFGVSIDYLVCKE